MFPHIESKLSSDISVGSSYSIASSNASSSTQTSKYSINSKLYRKELYQNEIKTLRKMIETNHLSSHSSEEEQKMNLDNDYSPALEMYDDNLQIWCDKRKKKINSKFTLQEKRHLKKWFKALDADGSGSVNIKELMEPLLSAGILETKEDVVRILSSVDEDNSGEINFHEFVEAIYGNKLCKKQQLKVLESMASDKHGFSMDLLLSLERRRNLMKNVIDEAMNRFHEMDIVLASHHSVTQRRHHRQTSSVQDNKKSAVSADNRKKRKNSINNDSNSKESKEVEEEMIIDARVRNLLMEHNAERRATTRYLDALGEVLQEKVSLLQDESDHDLARESRRASISHAYKLMEIREKPMTIDLELEMQNKRKQADTIEEEDGEYEDDFETYEQKQTEAKDWGLPSVVVKGAKGLERSNSRVLVRGNSTANMDKDDSNQNSRKYISRSNSNLRSSFAEEKSGSEKSGIGKKVQLPNLKLSRQESKKIIVVKSDDQVNVNGNSNQIASQNSNMKMKRKVKKYGSKGQLMRQESNSVLESLVNEERNIKHSQVIRHVNLEKIQDNIDALTRKYGD